MPEIREVIDMNLNAAMRKLQRAILVRTGLVVKIGTSQFHSNDDFFIAGEWEAGAVNDADYPDGFYQYLNAERDYCFKISSVGGPYSLIPHFEILGK